MKISNIKKIICMIITVAIVLATAFCVFAKEASMEAVQDYMSMAGQSEYLKTDAQNLSANAEAIRQDYIFSGDEASIPSYSDKNTNVSTVVYNKALDITDNETLIAICKMFSESDDDTEIKVRYTSNDESSKLMIKAQNSRCTFAYSLEGATLNKDNNGYYVCSFKIPHDKLSDFSYYEEPEYDYHILKLISSNDSIIVHSISIEQGRGGYAVARAVVDEHDHVDPIAELTYSTQKDTLTAITVNADGSNIVVGSNLDKEPEVVLHSDDINTTWTNSLSQEEIEKLAELDGLVSKDEVNTKEAQNDETTLEINKEDDKYSSETSADSSNISNEDSADDSIDNSCEEIPEETIVEETDISERDYLSLTDSSVILRDGYVYSKEGIGYYRKKALADVSVEDYVNLYSNECALGQNNINVPSAVDMLGSNYQDILLLGNIMLLKIANITGSEYAGELSMSSSGFNSETTVTTTQEIEVPTKELAITTEEMPTEATQGAEEVTNKEVTAEASQEIVEVTTEAEGENATEDTATADEMPEEAVETVYVTTTKTVKEQNYISTFVKDSMDSVTIDDSIIKLTEAFLRKTSYCAIDADGVVCAVFNSHGRIVEMLDGYTEDDIAAFVMLPMTDSVDESEYLSDVSVVYNDVLASGDEYATIICSDENGEPLSASASMYSNTDANQEFEISSYVNNERGIISISGSAPESCIEVMQGGDYECQYTQGSLGDVEKKQELEEADEADYEETSDAAATFGDVDNVDNAGNVENGIGSGCEGENGSDNNQQTDATGISGDSGLSANNEVVTDNITSSNGDDQVASDAIIGDGTIDKHASADAEVNTEVLAGDDNNVDQTAILDTLDKGISAAEDTGQGVTEVTESDTHGNTGQNATEVTDKVTCDNTGQNTTEVTTQDVTTNTGQTIVESSVQSIADSASTVIGEICVQSEATIVPCD